MVGIFLVDKAADWTSRDVVNKLNHTLHFKKLGHTGTLDPFATGLLVVTAGPATKIMAFLNDLPKTYIATLKLGEKTPTGDIETTVDQRAPVPPLTINEINKVFQTFIGVNQQIPPLTSALKVDGQPLYRKAHAGETYEVKARSINIYALEIIHYDENNHILQFSVQCSSGTYVRTLAADFAKALGTVGYLLALRRTMIGHLLVDDAKDVLAISEKDIFSIRYALSYLPALPYQEDFYNAAINGRKIVLDAMPSDLVLILNQEDEVIAIYEREDQQLFHCKRGLQ